MNKKRVAVYVDGLSLYHSLDDWVKEKAKQSEKAASHYFKWLDLRALAENLCREIETNKSKAKLVGVYYFSARGGMKKRKDKTEVEKKAIDKRHKNYVKALKQKGVVCDLSYFTFSRKTFPLEHPESWIEVKEKETDVKLTIKMLEDALENRIDIAILISADGDFVPLLKRIREKYAKKAMVSVTKNRMGKIKKRKLAYGGMENIISISRKMILLCQLPDRIEIKDNKYLERPEKYRNPEL